MAEITINREDAIRIINNPDAGPDARVIAAHTIAFFETADHAADAEGATRAIALKLTHMTIEQIYKGDES